MIVHSVNRADPRGGPDYSDQSEVDRFRVRQQKDLERWKAKVGDHDSSSEEEGFSDSSIKDASEHSKHAPFANKPGWKNAEGERLEDYGVDEDVAVYEKQDSNPGRARKRIPTAGSHSFSTDC